MLTMGETTGAQTKLCSRLRPLAWLSEGRRRETVEAPISRLHVFRNRLTHHQRVWSHAPDERYEDLLTLAG
jgi:hypothetical protein